MRDETAATGGSLFGTGPNGIFRRTVPKPEEQTDRRMLRVLGLPQLTMIGVGAIIGAGIFSLAGAVARDVAGPAVLVSFLIAGAASLCAAFAYAEFAGMVPRAGSSYTYAAAVLGEVVGWIIGWDLLLEYTAIVATVSIGMSGYAGFLLESVGLQLPVWMLGAPGTGEGHRVDLIAMLICLGVAWLLNRGTKTSAKVDVVLTVVKIAVVLLVVVVGLSKVDFGNLTPFAPFGWGGAVTGAATVFFAVFGYDALSTAAEESVEARKLLPKAMMLSLAISMVLYVGACIVLTGMVSYDQVDPDSGFSSAFASVGLSGVAVVIAVGAVLGIVTVSFSFMMGASRLWYALSRDGLMPKWFGELHPVRRVPHRATWILGIVSAVLAGLLPVQEAAELTNIGVLFAFVLVCAAVVVLRYRRPDLPRGFRCPGMPVVPVLGVLFSAWLMSFLAAETWLRFAGWLLLGLLVYALYSYRSTRRVMPGGSADLSSLDEPGR
ncbi:amino acid/polyamine/organocation transporter, APC superfamily [Saccharopolyspora antimicrobica]|uniref:Amino acid/polyamine/organocation transporter (APC superfamily) n=1 Tax=Saccharopolyspora antimicrobica TaxID=455193 RepID=A0A1I4SH33_9PSEU|nr:amino acid permease [Saccharopolyspora antimicrobica]RKT87742.1 amino acid/polyamine/organocation transporter (APC superfamily) [Saccharopolyspora antimicrobica]SFM63769.1 amino acid/polyamine/organocation transporter, APC superfamily [Saccharopolyspora antimicrobica]